MSGKLGLFVGVSICLTMLLFITQLGIDNVNDELGTDTSIFNYDGSHIEQFNTGANGSYVLDADVEGAIPDTTTQVDSESNFFTDIWNAVIEWLTDVTGIKYVLSVLNALPNFIAIMFPPEYQAIGFALGYLWHALTVFALIFWIKGGGN